MKKKIIQDLKIILEAAIDGYSMAEHDANIAVNEAAKRMKQYGDAFASIEAIKKIVKEG